MAWFQESHATTTSHVVREMPLADFSVEYRHNAQEHAQHGTPRSCYSSPVKKDDGWKRTQAMRWYR